MPSAPPARRSPHATPEDGPIRRATPEPAPDARWQRARELFLDLADLEPAERGLALEAIGAEDADLRTWVERLLAHDAGPEPETRGRPPRRCGPYETLRLIATGGMGEVWLARRVDGAFEREVAIKLLRPGHTSEELVERFLRERRTLARLDHEFVAKLLDGGTTDDGQPFLVLEYVEGRPLDEYARASELDLRGRVELFRRVVEAVRHAHGAGVVHRDLKPGNILVRDDGTPRLLDFGIARPRPEPETPVAPLTRTGHRLFTPEYAAPEQVRGDAATEATDVFALGVLLYELLADRGPWPRGLTLHSLERAILELDPAPPSRSRRGTTRRSVAGDLDTIALTCLAKRPEARYPSARELADDLDRYLEGRPIRARRTGALGRAWRYARRQPWRTAGIAAALVAAAAGAVAWRAQATGERRSVELVRSVEALVDAARVLRGQGLLTRADAELVEALRALDALPDDALLRAQVLRERAVVANHDERPEDALARIHEARGWLETLDEGATRGGAAAAIVPELTASLLNARAFALEASGRPDEAWSAAQAALAHCTDALPPAHELTIDAMIEIASQQRARGDVEAGLATLERAADDVRAYGDPRAEAVGRLENQRGLVLATAGRHAEAVEAFEEALAVFAWLFGERHPSVAQVRENMGGSLYRLRDFPASEEQHRAALAVHRALHLDAQVATSLQYLGRTLFAAGRLDEARDAFDEALELRERLFGPDHAQARETRFWIAYLQHFAGAHADSRERFERLLDDALWTGPLPPDYEQVARDTLGVLRSIGGD